MAEDTTSADATVGTSTTDTSTDTKPDAWTPPTQEAWTKLKADADRRDTLLREAQAKIAELSKPKSTDTTDTSTDTKPTEPSREDKLVEALRRTAATSVLSARGVTDTEEVSAVLSVLHLDTLPVDADRGTVDTKTLADTLDTLAKIFGKGTDTRRTPAVDTRRGSRDAGDPVDADTRRFRRIMGHGE